MARLDETTRELGQRLQAALEAGMTDEALKVWTKKVSTLVAEFEDDLMYRLKDELASSLSEWTRDMAHQAVESLLEGNEDQMRRYLSCEKRAEDGSWIGWTGRSTGYTGPNHDMAGQHPVIHGRLRESGAMELRKNIVEAHADLLKNERILDLEDQVRSLVAQVNKVSAEKEALGLRLRDEFRVSSGG